MARKKIMFAWITNDSARRATFKKRRKGLMKKVSELSTLCDVEACAIVYGPDEQRPEVWPPENATRVLACFKSLPEMEQSRKMMTREEFLRQQVTKLREQLWKLEHENRELETALLMYNGLAGQCSLHDVRLDDATSLALMIEDKLKVVRERIEAVVKAEMGSRATTKNVVVEEAMEALQQQDWFMGLISQDDHTVYGGGEEMVQAYVENVNPWLESYSYFPMV